jgi:hypothetical protein
VFLIRQTEIKSTIINVNKIPTEIKYDGKVVNAIEWIDKNGNNIVVVTETGIIESKSGDDNKSASLYAAHYISSKNSYALTWKITDFVKECPVYIEANFIPNTFQITDLNKDSVTEVWLMYKTACHRDVSPSAMKIIMHEDKIKFVFRRRNKVKISETETEGGEYTEDKAFVEGPKQFRDFAKKLWEQNMLQKWE